MSRESNSKTEYKTRVNGAIAFINEHLADDLNLAQVAQAANFSPFHFHRIFAALVGETPHEFLNRIRLERAANMLLKMPSYSITEIALACGFSSSATFARSFKKHFGVTASEYRKFGPGRPAQPAEPVGVNDETSRTIDSSVPSLHPVSGGEIERSLALQIRVKMMPRLHLAYVSNLAGYNLTQICPAWRKLYQWAEARDLITPQSKMIGISFDDPLITPKDKCRYYACITVTEEMTFDETVSLMDIPAGKYAVGRMSCSAEEIQLAYRFFYGKWFPDSGYQPANRPGYEIYHATPDINPAGKFIMDVCIPVVPL